MTVPERQLVVMSSTPRPVADSMQDSVTSILRSDKDQSRVAPSPKRGRPRGDQAGEVENRILDAATELFMERGFGRTTLDQVAAAARVGNTTLYKRYPGKEPLFTAVIHRSVERAVRQLHVKARQSTPEARLRHVGVAMLKNALTREVMAIMRISAAEAENFPTVARAGYRVGFDACVEQAAHAIAGSVGADAVAAALPAATRFVELALHPLELQGMFGVDLAVLRPRIEQSVDDAIAMLAATGLLPAV
ncbi:MAG: TetR/AcrR family transcriptional regulator [Sphingobium sp.]|uniref:TetR/AcrR family transcriptional regulator n=1 Tax=Sphingobium sp. TaxID=1912891 RepID=UPI0029B1A3E2|nr:TetR/AcrR family transcriptional regulator [Sphingobium sp.]MDX3911517.1 TetR/AcrR family transcriptional regulator [Sphingobium sp.]